MSTACKHETPKGMAYDHSICLDCYSIFTDTRWGVASLKWFRNRDAAEFYRATGRYPDGDDPRDAEISSLTARVEELERLLREAQVYCPHDPVSNALGDRINVVLQDGRDG